jgi:hypothetical protein
MPFGYKAAWSNAGTGGATWAEAEALAQRLAEDEQTLKRRFWQKLRALAARLPFAEDLVAAHYCAFDRQTPLHVKAALIGALAYFVLPADVVPDVLGDRLYRRRGDAGRRHQTCRLAHHPGSPRSRPAEARPHARRKLILAITASTRSSPSLCARRSP